MSRDSSPAPSTDDSAVGSMSSCITNSEKNSTNSCSTNQINNGIGLNVTNAIRPTTDTATEPPQIRPKITRPSAKDFKVDSDDLRLAAKQMRSSNVSLISRSVRTYLSCFDDLDVERFESRTDYLINFKSNGINNCSSSVLRPVSILWPENYEGIVDQLAILDAFLLNTEFRERPVDWMLKRGLTTTPDCRLCKAKMTLKYENNIVRWQCQKSQACSSYSMPIQRPSFFSSYENVALDKLLFSVYYWSTCTPAEDLYAQINIETHILDGIWRRIQNVCRTALEKSYPRHRLTNTEEGLDPNNPSEPIDLVSIKLNDVFVVCAKHPRSNLVRLGLYIHDVSMYSFVDLTESWFAHGAYIRVSESKFLDLNKKRPDLKVDLVQRKDIVAKDGRFYRESAFGYLICQLSHVFKDFNSSSLSRESLKLILAEMQWRELYGTTPFDAFTNIVNHMAQYGEASDWYSEPSRPVDGEESCDKQDNHVAQSLGGTEYVWAEKYFYATVDPIDKDGKIICRFKEPQNLEEPPLAVVRIRCHHCNHWFESFNFSIHMLSHVETNRMEFEKKEYRKKGLVECKHCFKTFKRELIAIHATLLRTHMHLVQFGCRICCIRLNDRAEYLQHMRRVHFEHETPYRCPTCAFASSFQRDVFIHFQEEHRHTMSLLCPLCLRSFTVSNPEAMNSAKMVQLSNILYNHLAEHYVVSKGYTCSNCCLCFLDNDKLLNHKRLHHNVLEVRQTDTTKLEPFIVTRDEENYCVKAIPMELFIANKRPNLPLDHGSSKLSRKVSKKKRVIVFNNSSSNSTSSSSGSDNESDSNSYGNADGPVGDKTKKGTKKTSVRVGNVALGSNKALDNLDDRPSSPTSDSDDSFCTANGDEDTIHVRGLSEADKFLDGGAANLRVSKVRPSGSSKQVSSNKANLPSDFSSTRLIRYLSKMKRADGVIPNQSVILTPKGLPAKCGECFQFITIDHFVGKIVCKKCRYTTHCPRAATLHNTTRHS